MKIAGAVIIIISSILIGFFLCDNLKSRQKNISAIISFVEYISVNIKMYRLPLDKIYESFKDEYLTKKGFTERLDKGVYYAATKSDILHGDEESEIIRNFSEKIGSGTADEMEKLCVFTAERLRNLEEKLLREFPEKQKIYRTISALAGISVVIMII